MTVVDLEARRVALLAGDLAGELHARGVLLADIDDVDDVARWRTAARVAARTLGWHVRTGVSNGIVWAASDDWAPPGGADRDAARLVAAIVHRPPRHD
jgi:hypothetical protein